MQARARWPSCSGHTLRRMRPLPPWPHSWPSCCSRATRPATARRRCAASWVVAQARWVHMCRQQPSSLRAAAQGPPGGPSPPPLHPTAAVGPAGRTAAGGRCCRPGRRFFAAGGADAPWRPGRCRLPVRWGEGWWNGAPAPLADKTKRAWLNFRTAWPCPLGCSAARCPHLPRHPRLPPRRGVRAAAPAVLCVHLAARAGCQQHCYC